MRWLKHLTAATDDPKVARLLSEGGPLAYGTWWLILETIGKQMDAKTDVCEATFPRSQWAARLHCRPSDLRARLRVILNAGLVEEVNSESAQDSFGIGKDPPITLRARSLLKYRDEWSQRSGATRERLASKNDSQSQMQKQGQIVEGATDVHDTPRQRAAAIRGLRPTFPLGQKPSTLPLTEVSSLSALMSEILSFEDKLGCRMITDGEPLDKLALKLMSAASEVGLSPEAAVEKLRLARQKCRSRPDLRPQGAGWLFGVIRGKEFGGKAREVA